jgi:hypothetical protein
VSRLVLAEALKLVTTRRWLWLGLAAVGVTALFTGLAIAFADHPDTFTLPFTSAAGQRTLFGIGNSAAPFAAVLGAVGLTTEFRHRTATATFLATPSRGRVVGAKAAVHALAGVVYALVCIAVNVAIVGPWLAVGGIDLVLAPGEFAATFAGVVTSVAMFGAIGVAVGSLVRDQVAATTGLLVWLFVIENVVTAIPALHTWTVYLPGQAQEALVGTVLADRPFLTPVQGGVVLGAYATVLAIAGIRFALARDIT